jgi:hypothetical protein
MKRLALFAAVVVLWLIALAFVFAVGLVYFHPEPSP